MPNPLTVYSHEGTVGSLESEEHAMNRTQYRRIANRVATPRPSTHTSPGATAQKPGWNVSERGCIKAPSIVLGQVARMIGGVS